MQVITNRPIVYSNASGVTPEDDALLKKIKSKCGNRPGALRKKARRQFDACRDTIIKASKTKPVKKEKTGKSEIQKKADAVSKTKEAEKTQDAKTTESGQEQTQDTSKTKKMLLIGGGVLLAIIVVSVLSRRKK